jgi:hypothetical protein
MKTLVVSSLMVVAAAAAGTHPADTWEWTMESGYLWQVGLRQEITPGVSLPGGVCFTHHSNLGMTDPNPGIDALGFTLGRSWKF